MINIYLSNTNKLIISKKISINLIDYIAIGSGLEDLNIDKLKIGIFK